MIMCIFAKQDGEALKTIFTVMFVRFSFKSSGYVFAIDRVMEMSEKSFRSLTFSMCVFIARSDRLFE